MRTSSSPIKKRPRGADPAAANGDGHSSGSSSSSKRRSEEGDKEDKNDATERREETHAAAQVDLQRALKQLPHQVGAIRVLDFGTLKPHSPSFHSPISLFPVGYKSEITVEHRESPFRPASKETVLCEVLEVGDEPEFVLTVRSSGRVFIAPSEDGVWKKVGREERTTRTELHCGPCAEI